MNKAYKKLNKQEIINGYTEFIKQKGICQKLNCEKCPVYYIYNNGQDCEEHLDCGYVDTTKEWPQAVEKAKEVLFAMLLEEKLRE